MCSVMDVELLEEIVTLAEEEGSHNRKDTFKIFIEDMLPMEVLASLAEIHGSEDFIDDIWSERYERGTVNDAEEVGEDIEKGSCYVCERKVRLTRHHLFPRETHKRMLKQGISENVLNETIPICRMCHSTIHRFFTNDDLANAFFTLELLLSDERFLRYAKWASAQSHKRNGRVK